MANKHGDFIWYELMTTDPDAAAEFYATLIGWDVTDSGQSGMDYRLFSMAGAHIGGLMPLSPEMLTGGARPMWVGYIGVDDVDGSARRIRDAGGTVFVEPQDIPGVGRFAYVADPQGVSFYVMKGASEGTSDSFAAEAPRVGHCAWNELVTTDPEAAKAFYGEQFGWVKDGDMDMGPMGKYEFLRHGFLLGAVMPKPDEMPVPMWTYYFRVPDIDVAAATIKAQGGQLLVGPQEIPGGDLILNALDPRGAAFALIGKRV